MLEDKEYYDQPLEPEAIPAWADDVRKYAESWLEDARGWFKGRNDVRILDLGAGSCTTSLILSREFFVAEIVAADLSVMRMQQTIPHTAAIFGGRPEKLSFAQINMNEHFDLPSDSFDLVLTDAALHHSRNIWLTLAEIRRVLKPRGYFVAQREQYVSPLTAGYSLRKLLRTEEVQAGVSENAYLKSQYDYYLRANGFEPRFLAVLAEPRFKWLFFANGWLFSKYNILARSTRAEPAHEAARPQEDEREAARPAGDAAHPVHS